MLGAPPKSVRKRAEREKKRSVCAAARRSDSLGELCRLRVRRMKNYILDIKSHT